VVRGVAVSLSVEEIYQGIKWRDRPIKIKSITRIKFRDRNNNNELRDSSSVKIEFLSNFLPEYISIWSVTIWRSKVKPFVNRIRRCFNYLKWGHFSAFCRRGPTCSSCRFHDNESCMNSDFTYPDCNLETSVF